MIGEGCDKRMETRKPLDIYLNKFIDDEPYMVRSADISRDGIYLTKLIEPDLPEGSMVSLEFMLPNSDEILWARGAIMREGRRWGADGAGIWFTIMPEGYRKLVEDFVVSEN
jgi:hypothetical protein